MAVSKQTVAQAVDNLGFGRYQIQLSMAMGLANVADAMEMMILSILAPALHCHWHISKYQQALLTMVVFLGMFFSSPLLGVQADKYGRRPTVIWCSFFLCYFGFISALAPTFGWMLFLRFMVGFFIGGMPQACTLYAEFLPTSTRGKSIMALSFFWAFGACFESLLAWAVMPTLGWRYLVGLSTLPLVLFLMISPWVPESLLFLSISGRHEEADKLINQIASINGKSKTIGRIELEHKGTGSQKHSRGDFLNLFRHGRHKLTLMVWFLWFVAAASYYGVVLLSTELLNSSNNVCRSGSGQVAAGNATLEELECSVHTCRGLLKSDYVELIWTTLAEYPGTLLALCLIDRLGRRKTLSLLSLLFGFVTLLMMECSMNKQLLVFVLFCARGLSTGFFQVIYVYTPEAYSTDLRALALGTGSGSARIGAMTTPFVAQVLLKTSLVGSVACYAGLGFLAGLVSWFLPVETSGVSLADTGRVLHDGRQELTNEDDDELNAPAR